MRVVDPVPRVNKMGDERKVSGVELGELAIEA
jgi:hypothetical protein